MRFSELRKLVNQLTQSSGGTDLVNTGYGKWELVFDVPAGYDYQIVGAGFINSLTEIPLVGGVEDPFDGAAGDITLARTQAWVTPTAARPCRVRVGMALHFPEAASAMVRDPATNQFSATAEVGFLAV